MAEPARLALDEHDRQPVTTATLARSGVSFDDLVRRLHPLVRLDPAPGGALARSGRHVGAVRVGGLHVTVRPRLGAAELATLVRAVWSDVPTREQAPVQTGRLGLDEVLGRLLADEAAALLAAGPVRRYGRRREPLGVVRGRPDFAGSFPWSPQAPTPLVCVHHPISADNVHNRLVRAGLDRSATLDVGPATRRALAAQRTAWGSVARAVHPTRADFARARQRSDRLTARYALALRLSELVCRGASPTGLLGGPDAAAGLVLDMADLFECWTERVISEWAAPRGLAVRTQFRDTAFRDATGAVYSRIRPDLVVRRDGVPVAVIDAKYKPYWAARPDGRPVRKVSTADLYQLFFYTQRLQVQARLEHAPAAIVASPVPAADERRQPVVDGRYRHVSWQAGADASGAAALALLPLTDWLRASGDAARQAIIDASLEPLGLPDAVV